MKKKILLGLGIVVLVLIGVVVLAVVRANDVVRLLQPQIEQQLSKAVGAPVTIGTLDISIFPRAQLVVRGITLGNQSTPSIATLKAKLALRSLLDRTLDISEVRVERPMLLLERSKGGLAVAGLPQRRTEDAGRDVTAAPSSTPEAPPQLRESASFQVHLQRIIVEDGSVTIKNVEDGTSATLSDLNLDAGLQLDGALVNVPHAELHVMAPGAQHLSLAIRSATLNRNASTLNVSEAVLTSDAGAVRAEAALTLDTQRGTIQASAEKLDIGALARHAQGFAPGLADLALKGTLAVPRATITLTGPSDLSFNAPVQLRDVSMTLSGGQAIQALNGDLTLAGSHADLRFGSKALSLSLNRTPLTVALDGQFRIGAPNTLSITRLDLRGFDGSASFPFTLQLSSPPQIDTNVDLKGMSIRSLLSAFQPEKGTHLSGTIASLTAQINGALGPQGPNVRGPGRISVKDVVLAGFNLPHAVLSSIGKGLPFVEETIIDSVPPEFQKIMQDPDTRIQRLDSNFELQGDQTMLRSLKAVGDIFSLESNGSITRDGTLDLATTLTFTPEFSQALARRVKNIGKAYDSSGRLVVPLTLQGRSPKLLVLPDLSKLMQTGAGRIIEREAERAIDKALGKDSDTARGVKDLLDGFLKR